MAHHAKIENGIVTQVIVTMDLDEETFADRMLAETGEQWVRTSYNAKIRANFAGKGYIYNKEADVFHAPDPKCHDERILDVKTYRWKCTNPEHDVKLPG